MQILLKYANKFRAISIYNNKSIKNMPLVNKSIDETLSKASITVLKIFLKYGKFQIIHLYDKFITFQFADANFCIGNKTFLTGYFVECFIFDLECFVKSKFYKI